MSYSVGTTYASSEAEMNSMVTDLLNAGYTIIYVIPNNTIRISPTFTAATTPQGYTIGILGEKG